MGLDSFVFRTGKENIEYTDDNLEKVGYFRKVNCIHIWVEENLNGGEQTNCDFIEIPEDKLDKLIDSLQKVKNDNSLASELLPSCSRFFFGSTSYDEWYFADIDEALETFTKIKNTTDFNTQKILYYSWW
nr:MAG TPA: hypothetical protein [Caudoviricetes sp.]